MDRRNFLKIAGATTAAGLTVGGAANAMDLVLPRPDSVSPSTDAFTAKKWALVIDIKKIDEEMVEKIVTACNEAHNVPTITYKRKKLPNGELEEGTLDKNHEIKWIWEDEFENVFPGQENHHLPPDVTRLSVLALCNHCEEPPCVRVCPTKATFQRKDGIVLMDFHRCIGCRFCMAACPYGSRSFNFRDPRDPRFSTWKIEDAVSTFPTRTKGVVEKCNLCAERLAKGVPPACVEACEDNEIMFGDLEDPDSTVSIALRNNYTIRRKPELGTQPKVYYII